MSCLGSRCIYFIDSFQNILWILWLLLFSLHFHQSIINLRECLLCIIVILYSEAALEACLLQTQKKDFFFSSRYRGCKKLILGRQYLVALFLFVFFLFLYDMSTAPQIKCKKRDKGKWAYAVEEEARRDGESIYLK